MAESNYESKWWGYIYDQMMADGLADWLATNRRFYRSSLQSVTGPVLECACGTGLILLPLLASGHDMVGFDISQAMLATLERKAKAQEIDDIERRLSLQDFETFNYEQSFAAVIIPSNSFSMLATQEAQIRTLKNIYAHLAPQGQLLLDLRLAGVQSLVENSKPVTGRWHTFIHPETGHPIRQRVDSRLDFDHQLILDRCFIEYEAGSETFPMTARWIFKEEFQLLLRLAGFERWDVFATPDRDRLQIGLEDVHSYWIAYKS